MRKPKKKSRKVDLRRIKPTETYNFKQIANDLDRTKETVERWKREGMPVIPNTSPPLVDGADLLEFHRTRQEARKRPCKDDEAYCFTCKAQSQFSVGSVVIRPVNKKRFSIDGDCSECNGEMHKGASMERIDEFEVMFESFMKNLRFIERYR